MSYRKFFADVRANQIAWEQSGKFEGDIVLSEEQGNEWFNTASPSPNGEVPFVTEVEFSEYCSTKLQSGMRGVEGNIDSLNTASSPIGTGDWVEEEMEIITSV